MSQIHFDVVKDASPTSWMLFLPGIFGQGRNWNSVARRLVRERPEWAADGDPSSDPAICR